MPPATPHSSLAVTINQLRSELGRYYGFGRTYASMTASQQADVDATIDRGLRQFFAPPILQDGTSHVWSFMRPTANMIVHAPYTTGSLTKIDHNDNTQMALFSGTTLPDWVADAVLTFNHPTTGIETILHIHSKNSATELLLEDALASEDFTGQTVPYTITDGIQALPTTFGGIEGDMTLASGSGYMPVRQVGEDRIREMFLNRAIQTGVPAYFAVRPWRDPNMDRIGNQGNIGQYTRYEVIFFPRPDATYRLSYRYLFVFPGLADLLATGNATTEMWPPGMAYHHETILASCLAVAEEYADSPNGKHKENFRNRIAASVALDRKSAGAAYLGTNDDKSDTLYSQGRASPRVTVTYNNVLY